MIEAIELTKFYGTRCVVDRVSFKIGPGEVLGFLGPNGAGKSTTMKMLTGFLHPSSGHARIDGVEVSSDATETRRKLGYLPENGPLYEEMTVREFLDFIGAIRNAHLSPSERARSVEQVMETCHLTPVAKQTIDTLSKGFHQRVGVAQAIIHDPQYLILDEPTDGLDPNQKQEVRSLIRRMASTKSIILSTHILEEVDAMCNRVIIISDGKLVVDEKPEDLRKRHPKYNGISLRLDVGDAPSMEEALRKRFPSAKITCEADCVEIVPSTREALASEVLHFAHACQWPVSSFERLDSRLDEVFRMLTAGARPS